MLSQELCESVHETLRILISTMNVRYSLIQHIVTEHLLSIRHYSRCLRYRHKENSPKYPLLWISYLSGERKKKTQKVEHIEYQRVVSVVEQKNKSKTG